MADLTTGELQAVAIGDLPLAPDIYDDTKIPVEQNGEAKQMTGAQWKAYGIAAAREEADRAAENAAHQPIIQSGTWWTWDSTQEMYVDTGTKVQGERGPQGEKGKTGEKGDTGTGIKSIERTAGNGAPGTIDTYTITYTDDSTSTYTVYNGKDGEDGYTPKKGVDYFDGTSVTVQSVSESTEDGGNNVVTFSDGTELNVKNGSKGADGEPGKTPVKGTDYWTDEDKQEIVDELAEQVAPVSYNAQTLNEEQKAQVRENIGAAQALDYTAYGLPVLALTGDVSSMTKDNSVTLNYVYGDRSGTASVKWQGSSSLAYPKKNYTIKFDKAFEAVEGWGEEKKYCLKANYIDFSHARNVVSAKLWGQMVKSRTTVPTELANLPNGGAVDGFPICVVINGKYQGLYTFNIPKDGWMMGMGDGTAECIMVANHHSDATKFEGLARCDETDFEIEYVPDEDNAQWAIDSLNRLISAVMNSDGSDMDSVVAQYVDIDSAIDFYIFTCLLSGGDNYDKNYLLSTFDGVKWFFTMYDMDATYGLWWDGKGYDAPATAYPTLVSFRHSLVTLLKKFKTDEVKARYKALRASVLTESNIIDTFSNFVTGIPSRLYFEDTSLWPGVPSTATNNLAQIAENVRLRVALLDAQIDTLEAVDPGDLIAPAMIAPQNTWYKGTTAKSSIIKIDVVTRYVETGNEDESWNADVDDIGTIKCFVESSTLTIASMNGSSKIMLSYNMVGMFGGNDENIFSNVTEINGMEKFVSEPGGSTMTNCCRNMAKLTKPIVIPDGVANLNSAFMGCASMTEPPVIPESVTNLNYILSGCTALTSLPEIPATFAGPMTSAFYDCSSVVSVNVVIPEGVTKIDYAFYTMKKASGTVEINAANPAYGGAFANACTDVSSTGIVLSGTCPVLAEIAATNAQGKVTVSS